MMKSRIVLELGKASHVKFQCEELDIPYRCLDKTQEIYQLEWFRLHKYIQSYDEDLFISQGIFPENIKHLFESHQQGKLGTFYSRCFLLGKSCLDTFCPPDTQISKNKAKNYFQSDK